MSHRFETGTFSNICQMLTYNFVHRAQKVDVGEWQSLDVSDKPEMITHELLDCTIGFWIPATSWDLEDLVQPNLPWAEDHFQERVSGEPLNPPPSEEYWPFNRRNHIFKKDEKFSHTYPERFWPRYAGTRSSMSYEQREELGAHHYPNRGIRFEYGDLNDVVIQLQKSMYTRQAYLPVWFPEDTGVVHGERVPCTLGYHFIIRGKGEFTKLHCIYYIRSCDFLRHFRDDVYMAARLTQWVAERVGVPLGRLTMHITSFHVFEGDMPVLRRQLDTANS